jgi:hypothetical protein
MATSGDIGQPGRRTRIFFPVLEYVRTSTLQVPYRIFAHACLAFDLYRCCEMDNYQAGEAPRPHRPTLRSHSTRCCTLCRRRKTRCELPSAALLLPASPDPLPPHQACHRCNVLSVPCILTPVAKKLARNIRPRPASSSNVVGESRDASQSVHAGSTSSCIAGTSPPQLPIVNHGLDILSTFAVATEKKVRASILSR